MKTKQNTAGNAKNVELQREYRIALGLWSEARALYPGDSSEVERATEHLRTLEHELSQARAETAEALIPAMEL